MMPNRIPRHWPIILATLALTYLVVVVFYPIPGFSFITLDVNEQLLNNPSVRGLTAQNVKHILTTPCIASYYPVRSLTFALDHQIWGLDPAGFKLTGGLIHLANVLLVFWLIVRLFRSPSAAEGGDERPPGVDTGQVAVAAFSAGLFAVHPVVVEPVTWVAGREELLMTLGALGCIHFHLSARRLDHEQGRSWRRAACFVAAAVCCVFACLSNAVGVVIPALVATFDALTLPKPKLGRILRGTLALWLIGGATVAVKGLLPSGPQADLPWSILSRQPGVALVGYWLNLRTLAWPTDLSLSYTTIRPDNLPIAQVVLGFVAVVATGGLIWIARRHTRIVFGLLWFCLALAPTSQLLPHHVSRADRFLYLPLAGLAVVAAMALALLRRRLGSRAAWIAAAAAGIGLLILLEVLSTRQVHTWRNDVTLWERSVALGPDNPRAHGYLGDALRELGDTARAAESYRKSFQIDPDCAGVLNNYAICLTSDGKPRMDDHRLAVELAERGCRITEWQDPDLTHTLARAHTSLANTYHAAGRHDLAIEHYESAVRAHPRYDMAMFNLAVLLSTCPDKSLRQPDRAVQLAEQGCRLVGWPDAHRLGILATAYAGAGRFDDAVAVT
ncbi:MAG: tetratricopeptide repeat protein, partial [Planctomycetes bacterium]|nr:tetratricopeptide repeat protein [Planctomycetota bacterium]